MPHEPIVALSVNSDELAVVAPAVAVEVGPREIRRTKSFRPVATVTVVLVAVQRVERSQRTCEDEVFVVLDEAENGDEPRDDRDVPPLVSRMPSVDGDVPIVIATASKLSQPFQLATVAPAAARRGRLRSR